LLNSRRFSRLIAEAKNEYGYILFDTPPVGTFVDAAVLGAKVDAVFMVVREQFTRKDEVARAADQLRTANVPLAGIVMNFCERQSNEYYYEYYYREGKSSRGDAPKFSPNAKFDLQDQPFGDNASTDAGAQNGSQRNWSNAPDLNADDAE
jgi:Mrp family chromosome partitioning ATPase